MSVQTTVELQRQRIHHCQESIMSLSYRDALVKALAEAVPPTPKANEISWAAPKAISRFGRLFNIMASVPVHQGIVRNVLSGDTLVVRRLNDPLKVEKVVHFAFVSAPRLRREGDEPFAFASRDFLRVKIIGKLVQFQILYTVPNATGPPREYVKLMTEPGESYPELPLLEGWVKLRDDASRKAEDTPVYKSLVERCELEEAKAKAESKGVWSGPAPELTLQHDIPDVKAFAEEWKDKGIEAIVERVLTGDRLLMRLLISDTKHIQTVIIMAGIRAPSTKRTNANGLITPAEPFGEEAQEFIDVRIMLRKLTCTIVGVSPQNQLICKTHHFKFGDIADYILRDGLARVNDHHSTMLGAKSMARLRHFEGEAKEAKRNLFEGHVARANVPGVDVTVSRVQSADTIYVRSKDGTEKRVNLSSVRQPKPGDPEQAPFQAEAKEFARKKLIGKHVRLTIDGKKAASEGFEEREVASIFHNDKNFSLLLVENGYASVIRHRRDDTDRSMSYDALLAAEEGAIAAQKGMWSKKPPTIKNYVDFSESLQKAKVQASVLQRQKKIPAIVDFVKSGSRFTVLIPRENGKITVVLSCIRAPRSARNASEASEPYGQEAHDFANRKCLQRDVEIDIEGVDKVGGFIGTIYVNRENFSKLLLEEGLATVHAYSAEQSSSGAELFAAEKKAQDARRGVWTNYDPNEGGEAATPAPANGDPAPPAPRKAVYHEGTLTYIDPDSLNLKIQIVGTGTGALEEMMTRFRNTHLSGTRPAALPTPPRAGEYVSAKFSQDGLWYRARIRRNDRDASASEVQYIDFGNEEKVPWSALRALPTNFGTGVLKAQAQDATLSCIQFPASKEYLKDAESYLYRELDSRSLGVRVDFTDKDGTMYVTLYSAADKEEDDSVNAALVALGLALVPKKVRVWEKGMEVMLAGLKKKEEGAKAEREGMWEYGDITEED